jgi:hypothetical protein
MALSSTRARGAHCLEHKTIGWRYLAIDSGEWHLGVALGDKFECSARAQVDLTRY